MITLLRIFALTMAITGVMYIHAMEQGSSFYSEVDLSSSTAYDRPGVYDDSRIIGKAHTEPSSPITSDEESTSPVLPSQNGRSRSDTHNIKDADTLELSGGLIVQINKKLHRDLDKLNADFHEALFPRKGFPNFKKAEGLLRAGADINSLNKNGVPAVVVAVQNRAFPVLEFLAKKGANLNKQSENRGNASIRIKEATALQEAVRSGSIPYVRILLEKGADPNIANEHDTTPIFFVALSPTNDRVQMARLLINAGANLLVVNKQGQTPITLAQMFRGNEELVSYLERKAREQEVAEQKRKEDAELEAKLIY